MPLVPGEAREWVTAVRSRFGEARADLTPTAQADRRRIAEIVDDDPGLIGRADALAAREDAIEEASDAFARSIRELEERAGAAGADERALRDAIADASERGVALVVLVRRQRLAIQVWSTEALNRDRGRAD